MADKFSEAGSGVNSYPKNNSILFSSFLNSAAFHVIVFELDEFSNARIGERSLRAGDDGSKRQVEYRKCDLRNADNDIRKLKRVATSAWMEMTIKCRT